MAQSQTADVPPPAVATRVGPLQYPQIARIARVTGDVRLVVHVRADGSVASAEVATTDSPLLNNAAVASARNSNFLCQRCGEGQETYSLTYTFSLRTIDCGFHRIRGPRCLYLWTCGPSQENRVLHPPEIGQAPGQVGIIADEFCIEPEYSTTSGT